MTVRSSLVDTVNEDLSASREVSTAGASVKSEELPDCMLDEEASNLNVPDVLIRISVNVTAPFEVSRVRVPEREGSEGTRAKTIVNGP